MMKFSIPTNWQDDLIPGLPRVAGSELYGKLSEDIIGGGRFSAVLLPVSLHKAEKHIHAAHQNDLRFNYILNATCLSDIPSLDSKRQDIIKFIDWLSSVGVDSVTISSPYLLPLIRKHAPQLKIVLSVLEMIHNETQAKRWEEMGVSKINLSVLDVNRNFPLLKRLRDHLRCELQLIPNLSCLSGCHAFHFHANASTHTTQSQRAAQGFMVDYYSLRCRHIRMSDPSEFIKSQWIRPEDIHHYEKIGIQWLKFAGREMESAQIHLIVKAYQQSYYHGDLLCLFSGAKKKIFNYKKYMLALKYLFRPQDINLFNLMAARHAFDTDWISIDNRKLDGFLDYFLQGKCQFECGRPCRYCEEVAERAIVIDHKKRKKTLESSEVFLRKLSDGSMFNGSWDHP